MNTTTNFSNEDLKLFQASRTFLFGLAYRLLGSVHETEDVLQEIFIKWQQQPKQDIINPQAWLTAVCTRHCIDLLYTLSTAFLLVLEKLSAKERAAYLLHDIFNFDYIEISEFLQETQSYCRQLVTRGRKHIKAEPKMLSTLPTSRQLVLLDAFKDAVHSQNIGQLKELLSEDIQFAADGGGKVSAIRHPFIGQSNVLRFFERLLFIAWNELSWKICLLNGNLGFKLYDHNQTYVTAITFNFNQSQISDIYVLRNPEKLK